MNDSKLARDISLKFYVLMLIKFCLFNLISSNVM